MDVRPIIGVPTRTLQAIEGTPEGLPHSRVMNHRYFLALTVVGAMPWMIPLLDNDPDTLREIYGNLDGLFVAGGVDVDPASYCEARHASCGVTDLPRDTAEVTMTRWALEESKPFLGVCRGMQILNVVPGSRLRAAFGAQRVLIDSMHHQGVRDLGEGLVPTSFAPDGLVESLETPSGAFAVGVQWHPETLIDRDAGTRRLFADFIEASQEWRLCKNATDIAA